MALFHKFYFFCLNSWFILRYLFWIFWDWFSYLSLHRYFCLLKFKIIILLKSNYIWASKLYCPKGRTKMSKTCWSLPLRNVPNLIPRKANACPLKANGAFFWSSPLMIYPDHLPKSRKSTIHNKKSVEFQRATLRFFLFIYTLNAMPKQAFGVTQVFQPSRRTPQKTGPAPRFPSGFQTTAQHFWTFWLCF